jgi:hypothetical protein
LFSGFAFSFDFYLFISYNYPQSLGSFLLEVAAEALPDEAEELGVVVDRSCVEEDVLLSFQSEISLAFKVRLSLGNNGEIKYDVSYLRVASAVLNQRRLLAIG